MTPTTTVAQVFKSRASRREGDRELPLGPKAQRTRRAIIDAAVELFTTDGWRRTTVADVAARAGVSLGTVYQYFRDRSEIATAIVHADVADMLRRTDTTWRASEGGPGLHRILRNFVEAYVDAGPRMRVWEEVVHVEDDMAALRRELGRLFTAAVAVELTNASAAGLIAADLDPDLTARALTAMVDRYCYVTYVFDPPERPPAVDTSADLLTRLWAAAIGLDVGAEGGVAESASSSTVPSASPPKTSVGRGPVWASASPSASPEPSPSVIRPSPR